MNHRTKSHVSVYLKRGGSIQLLVLSCLRLLETTECRFLSSVDGPGGVHQTFSGLSRVPLHERLIINGPVTSVRWRLANHSFSYYPWKAGL